ncbi:MAG: type II toxin-antitoxin system HicA family toxin [bacterium]|nr:type II toxin-antitoxin system HicA family toxin [bacterium]
MNRSQRNTLATVFAKPIAGNIEWRKIEALFKGAGCEVIEGSGSRITIVYKSRKATFHRPHPGKDILRYQIRAAREFLENIGVTP